MRQLPISTVVYDLEVMTLQCTAPVFVCQMIFYYGGYLLTSSTFLGGLTCQAS